jgi:hypothetical protein
VIYKVPRSYITVLDQDVQLQLHVIPNVITRNVFRRARVSFLVEYCGMLCTHTHTRTASSEEKEVGKNVRVVHMHRSFFNILVRSDDGVSTMFAPFMWNLFLLL